MLGACHAYPVLKVAPMNAVPRDPAECSAPTLVLGIGNVLMSDDGVGARVLAELGKVRLPEHVEAVDGGTAGADLVPLICGRERVIVVDAIEAEAVPGTVLELTIPQLQAATRPSLSLHDVSLLEAIQMASLLGSSPGHVLVLGIVPARIGPGLQLSRQVRQAVPRVVRRIRELTAAA